MNNGTVFETIHQGVPTDVPIFMATSDFLQLCDRNKEAEKIIDKAFDKYISFLKTFTRNKNGINIHFLKNMKIVTKKDSTEKMITFGEEGFLNSLLFNLNGFGLCYMQPNEYGAISLRKTVKDYYDELERRSNRLGKIKGEKSLKEEFPYIYRAYSEAKTLNDSLRDIAPMLQRVNPIARIKLVNGFATRFGIEPHQLEDMLKKQEGFSVQNFVKEYAENLTDLISHIPEIIEFLRTTEIDFSTLNAISKEKLELYIAHQYLFMIDTVGVAEEMKQKYLYYVSHYFFTHQDTITDDLKIIVGKNPKGLVNQTNGTTITPKSLYERYKNVLKNNPRLRIIDFTRDDFSDMTPQEIEKFMEEYLKDLNANWDFLTPDNQKTDREIIEKIKRIPLTPGQTEEQRRAKQERLLEMFTKKKEFFDSSDPFYRIKGKNTFDGYIGYIYPNGKVVLDKFFENADKGKVAQGQAIYIMDIKDFYNLSQLSKTTLMGSQLCKRFIHRGNWQERVKQEIQAKGDSPQSAVKKMMIQSIVTSE